MVNLQIISISCFVTILILVIGILECETVSVWQDLTLTSKEKRALDKFKVLMNNTVTHDYMRKDIYLIKWLRARDLNLEAAEEMLRQHLKWRREYKMDSVVYEDWTEMAREYPYTSDSVDYEGRPVLALSVADWDIRRAIVSGQKEKLIRYSFGAYEKGSQKVRELQEQNKNVTQFVMVCNFQSFNLVQHGCFQCVQVLVNFLASYEANFPGLAHLIIGIKTPATFQILLEALKTVMSKDTQDAVRIWGPNKLEWQKNLLEVVPPEELNEDFGGTRNKFN